MSSVLDFKSLKLFVLHMSYSRLKTSEFKLTNTEDLRIWVLLASLKFQETPSAYFWVINRRIQNLQYWRSSDLGTIGFFEVSRNSFSLFLIHQPKFSTNLSPPVHIFPALRGFFFLTHSSLPPPPLPLHPIPLIFPASFYLNLLWYH